MKILALDTSTEACSVALLADGVVHEQHQITPREHAHWVLSMAQNVLEEADVSLTQLDALAFGRGPGAFTGVRIGVGVAQGLAFATDLPVVPVSSLAAMAHGAWRSEGHAHVLAAIDARMGEIYAAACEVIAEGEVRFITTEQVCTAAELVPPTEDIWFGIGTGWDTFAADLGELFGERLIGYSGKDLPHARDVALIGAYRSQCGDCVVAEQALPVYLRDNVARKK